MQPACGDTRVCGHSTCTVQALAAACFCSDAEMPRANQSWLGSPRVTAPSAAPCPAKVSSCSCLWLGPAYGSPGLCHGSCFCPARHGEQLPSTAGLHPPSGHSPKKETPGASSPQPHSCWGWAVPGCTLLVLSTSGTPTEGTRSSSLRRISENARGALAAGVQQAPLAVLAWPLTSGRTQRSQDVSKG